jgi:hypothetical protein
LSAFVLGVQQKKQLLFTLTERQRQGEMRRNVVEVKKNRKSKGKMLALYFEEEGEKAYHCSYVSPARPSDRSSLKIKVKMEMKMLEW